MSDSNNNYLGNPDRPVLVKESWAKRVQAATAATERDAAFYGETGRPAFALSRFYDMRPAVLKSAWTQNSAGIYQATAAFVNSATGAVDASYIFPVTAPANTSAPEGTVDETRFFVAWRGRWEMIAGAGGGGGEAGVLTFSVAGTTKKDGDLYFDSAYFGYLSSDSTGHTIGLLINKIRGRINVAITLEDASTVQLSFGFANLT